LIEAESAMRQADAAREAVEALAAGTLIRARFDGVVLRRWHNPGDSVDATTADPVLRVVDPTRIEVTGMVPASQLGLIAPGRAARIFNPTDGGEITGVVITRPALSENMAAGEVRISFGAAAPALPIGTPVQAEIIGDSQTNVLAVPSLAVFHDGDQIFVVVAGEDGRARRQPVSTGIVTRDKTQIMSGLKAGDLVILSGADPVADGAAITVVR
jgi:RND family efflux transporter MFP subunit